MKRFAACFADLPDPRADNALHDLTELLFIALLATLCGATSCTDMALFARTKAYLLEPILVLKHGLSQPRHLQPGVPHARSAGLRAVVPALYESLRQGGQDQAAQGRGGARRQGAAARLRARQEPHAAVMVTAWAAQTRMALANMLAPNNNEAAAALQLIELMQLKGCVVTADALHCHRAMAKAITDAAATMCWR